MRVYSRPHFRPPLSMTSLAPSRLLALLAAGLLAAAAPTSAQVCDGDFLLQTQAEVDTFACTQVMGSLIVFGGEVTDLTGLAGLTYVRDEVRIEDSNITALTGLEALASVGSLTLSYALQVTDLRPLKALTEIRGSLFLRGMNGLVDLSGLDSLRRVEGSLTLLDNEALRDIKGLSGLNTVPGDLSILTNLSLRRLDGLGSITSLGGTLQITNNDALETLAGGPAVTEVGGLVLGANRLLTTLDGLPPIDTIRGPLGIGSHAALTDITALRTVTRVGGNLNVSTNLPLSTCACGLSGLIRDGSFAGVAGEVLFGFNDANGSCNSPEEVLADPTTCPATSARTSPIGRMTLSIAPNPTTSVARATYSLPTATNARVAVYDALGREVAVLADGPHTAGAHEASLDMLAPGVYLVRVVTEAGARTAALTVTR